MTGPRDASGLATALELLGAGDLGLGGEGSQEELLADALDAPSSLTPAKGKSGPQGGRPANARNRSTEDWRRYLASKYQSPLIGLAETWSRALDELAAELFLVCTVTHLAPGQQALATNTDKEGRVVSYLVWDRREAYAIQQAARVASLPYWHQKQPLAIAVKGNNRGLLVLNVQGGNGGVDAAADPFAPLEENQQVIDVTPEKSDDEQSDGKPNPLEFNGE
jgi:hypothetical protein